MSITTDERNTNSFHRLLWMLKHIALDPRNTTSVDDAALIWPHFYEMSLPDCARPGIFVSDLSAEQQSQYLKAVEENLSSQLYADAKKHIALCNRLKMPLSRLRDLKDRKNYKIARAKMAKAYSNPLFEALDSWYKTRLERLFRVTRPLYKAALPGLYKNNPGGGYTGFVAHLTTIQ